MPGLWQEAARPEHGVVQARGSNYRGKLIPGLMVCQFALIKGELKPLMAGEEEVHSGHLTPFLWFIQFGCLLTKLANISSVNIHAHTSSPHKNILYCY